MGVILTIKNRKMEIKNEIAYLEYGKTYNELSEGQKREVDCEYDDLVNLY
jgi:hypothetical protein